MYMLIHVLFKNVYIDGCIDSGFSSISCNGHGVLYSHLILISLLLTDQSDLNTLCDFMSLNIEFHIKLKVDNLFLTLSLRLNVRYPLSYCNELSSNQLISTL